MIRPRWAPSPFPTFENHKRLLDWMEGSIPAPGSGLTSICMLYGPPGIGKSTLVRQFASKHGGRFPGGQFRVDCTTNNSTLSVLRSLLEQIGINEEHMPADQESRYTLFQRLSPEEPVLIVLKNVTDAEQVSAALPNSRDSMVLVTTEKGPQTLGKLKAEGAQVQRVDPLSQEHSVTLLGKLCGRERITAEPEAASTLARLLGGNPDVLQKAGLRLELASSLTIAQMVREYSPEPGDPSGGEQYAAARAYDALYDALPEAARRLYRFLGWLPRIDISVAGVAAATGYHPGVTDDLLARLRSFTLVKDRPDERVELSELTRPHASRLAHANQAEDAEHKESLHALLRSFLVRAAYADRAIIGERRARAADHGALLGEHPDPFAAPTGKQRKALADAWLVSEQSSMVPLVEAAWEHGWHEEAWQLAEALTGAFYYNRRRLYEWVAVSEIGIRAAQELGNKPAEARLRLSLSRARSDGREFDAAWKEIDRAMSIAVNDPNLALLASVHEFRGRLLEASDPQQALEEYHQSWKLNRLAEEDRGAALAIFFSARLRGASDNATPVELEKALEDLGVATVSFRELDDHRMAGRALIAAGMTEDRLGRERDATTALQAAVSELEGAHYAAEALEILAVITERTGDTVTARGYLEAALRIYDNAGHPKARDVAERLPLESPAAPQ